MTAESQVARLLDELFDARLTPEEALAGATRHAARALGLEREAGTLEAGKAADIAVWDVERPAELAYWLGKPMLHKVYVGGEPRA